MSTVAKILGIALVGVIALGVVLYLVVLPDFFSARGKPGALETWAAARLRHLAVPSEIRDLPNPIAATPEALAEAREHFADHCATCHGNDGRGRVGTGVSFYPPAPDMTATETQSLTDGEIFYAIRNGVRFTGMPAWGSNSPEDTQASWKLVHFIRHLPSISRKELREMEKMNPQSPQEMEEQNEAERFLDGGEANEPSGHSH